MAMRRSNRFPLLLSIFFVIGLVTAIAGASSSGESDLLSEFVALQARSESGVIRLTDQLISRFISSKPPRPFSLLIFFDALQLHDKKELKLKFLRSEFAVVASSFISNNADNTSAKSKIFFCDIEFRESQSSFAQFGVNALPTIRLVPSTAQNLKDDTQVMDGGDFSHLAESFVDFIESKTLFTVGPIHRPPIVSKTQIVVILAALLISLPYAVKKVIAGETLLHDSKIWLAGAIFVYFFSVSGAMFNIIRNMPMFISDRNNPSKLVFFYQGSGMQLGAEGFTIGFLYTVVGILMAVVTHVLVKLQNVTAQRLIMLSSLLVSLWAVHGVVVLDHWKTGYGVHMYRPSRWQ